MQLPTWDHVMNALTFNSFLKERVRNESSYVSLA